MLVLLTFLSFLSFLFIDNFFGKGSRMSIVYWLPGVTIIALYVLIRKAVRDRGGQLHKTPPLPAVNWKYDEPLPNFILLLITFVLLYILFFTFPPEYMTQARTIVSDLMQKDYTSVYDAFVLYRKDSLSLLPFRSVQSVILPVVVNAVFFFYYLYFQKSSGYFFALVFSLVTINSLSGYIGLSVNYILLGITSLIVFSFMLLAFAIAHFRIKERITNFIRSVFAAIKVTLPYVAAFEYLLVCLPYFFLSTSVLIVMHFMYDITFAPLYHLIIINFFAYRYLYKAYREGRFFFDYDPY